MTALPPEIEGSTQGSPGRDEADTEPAGLLRIAYLGDPNSVHVRRWSAYFAGLGHSVTIVVAGRTPIEPGLAPGVSIVRFTPYTSRRNKLVGILAARRSLRRVLARLDPDVLHVHHVTVNAWHALLSGFRPYAVTVWGTDVLVTARQSGRGRLYAWLSLRSAALVTGGSETLVRAAIAAGARPERTRMLLWGVDVERFCPGEPRPGLRERLDLEGFRVVFAPRAIAPLYRQDVVVAALPFLPPDVAVLMTRHLADPAEVERIERLSASLGVADRLRMVPDVAYAEMPDFYRLADVVVTVPRSDGGPNTVVETLASGRPVVASDLPANREWLTEIDPAALVPVGDVDATARAISTVLGRPAEARRALAERGRAAVEARADQRRTMAEMEELYRALARERSVRRGGRSRT